ncbi:ADP-ribosyltransferase [Streptomyces sp. NPDC088762]|uniref:ADP-ribosyltransferase n=1 Tax=Streptomyces sp. NPDC088762 TaxID=3365891 RepID=UPI003801961A
MSELDTTESTADAPSPPPPPEVPEPVGEPQEAPEPTPLEAAPDASADPDAEPEEPEAPDEAADTDDADAEDSAEPDEPETLEDSATPKAPSEVDEAADDSAEDDDAEPDEPETLEDSAAPEAPLAVDEAADDSAEDDDAEPDEPETLEDSAAPEAPSAVDEAADDSAEDDHADDAVEDDDAEPDEPETPDDSAEPEAAAEGDEVADVEDGGDDDAGDVTGDDDPTPEEPDDELPELELELKPYDDSVPYSPEYTASLGVEEPDEASPPAPELPRDEEEQEAEASDEPQQAAAPESAPEGPDDGSAVREFSSNEEGAEYGRTEWAEAQNLLTGEQRDALYGYSGEKKEGEEGAPDYKDINGYLRGHAPGSPEVDNSIQRMDEGLELQPVPEDLTVMRETGLNSFNCPIEKVKGSVQTDPGYLSTALGSDPDFAPEKEVVLHLKVPEGTPAIYMEGLSQFDSERELLLGRGQSYLVTDATYDEDDHRYHVHGEIIR